MSRKVKVLLALLLVCAIIGAWQGARYWFNYGYASGTKTGTLRKLAVTGPPYCKYLDGEMALVGGNPGQPAEIWHFTIDDEGETSPVLQQLQQAERGAKPVTLRYRQDRGLWWRCSPSEYYVIGIDR
jgi:hypothetical protein